MAALIAIEQDRREQQHRLHESLVAAACGRPDQSSGGGRGGHREASARSVMVVGSSLRCEGKGDRPDVRGVRPVEEERAGYWIASQAEREAASLSAGRLTYGTDSSTDETVPSAR